MTEADLVAAINRRRLERGREPLRSSHIMRAIRFVRGSGLPTRHKAFALFQRKVRWCSGPNDRAPYRVTAEGWNLDLRWARDDQ